MRKAVVIMILVGLAGLGAISACWHNSGNDPIIANPEVITPAPVELTPIEVPIQQIDGRDQQPTNKETGTVSVHIKLW